MNSLDRRRIVMASGGLAVLALIALSNPIADIRIIHDATGTAVSRIETRIDLGVVAFSYLHSWKRAARIALP